MMKKIFWHLKQLLPLLYVATYAEFGTRKLSIWRMWFGRCFAIREYRILR